MAIKKFIRLNSDVQQLKFKRTNFLIDTLFCPRLKTPSGHPYNRSWTIWPPKQPLSSPRLTLLPSFKELIATDRNGDLKEAVLEAKWSMTCCKDVHWVF